MAGAGVCRAFDTEADLTGMVLSKSKATTNAGLPVSVCTWGVRSQSNRTLVFFLPLSCNHQMMEGHWGGSVRSYFLLMSSSSENYPKTVQITVSCCHSSSDKGNVSCVLLLVKTSGVSNGVVKNNKCEDAVESS